MKKVLAALDGPKRSEPALLRAAVFAGIGPSG
jgi:hypothetical protein